MERPLGNMEAALQLTRRFAPMSVAGVVRLRGAPDAGRVRDALQVLQRRQPLLRARIVTSARRMRFEVSSTVAPIPLTVLARKDDAHWQEIVADVINSNVDVESGPPLGCTYLVDSAAGEADLVFAYDHSVMDAVSASHMYGQLLTLCAGLTSPSDAAPLALPPSIDQLLPGHVTGLAKTTALGRYMGRQAADEFHYRRGIRGREAQIQPTARSVPIVRSLDESTTNGLVKNARTRRLTMNSVVGGALVMATYRNLHAGEKLPMRAITFADLRPSLRPTPGDEVLGCYLSMLRYTLDVDSDDDLWTVASRFQDHVRTSLERDEHLLAAGVARQLMRMITATKRMRMATTAVSYAGPLVLDERYGDIEVTEVHGFISNNRLGPVATAFAKIFRGSLSWNFVFLDTDMDQPTAEAISDTVTEILSSAGTS